MKSVLKKLSVCFILIIGLVQFSNLTKVKAECQAGSLETRDGKCYYNFEGYVCLSRDLIVDCEIQVEEEEADPEIGG